MKIGLIAMSAKPIHAGHVKLIEIASNETENVKLYVSLSDRKRSGEVPILGKDMEQIWKRYVEPSLPSNVEVTYGGSPVGNIYKFLGEENEAWSDDTYVIYSDPEDIAKNFPENKLEKYISNIYNRGGIILEPIQRSETSDISGFKMRQFIDLGDSESFNASLPPVLQKEGETVWNILRTTAMVTPRKTTRRKKNPRLRL